MNKPRILFSVLAPVLLLLVAGVLATLAQPHPQPAEAAWPAAPAATLTVDTAVDENDGSCNDGDCSLRDAIAAANPGDAIAFAGDTSSLLAVSW